MIECGHDTAKRCPGIQHRGIESRAHLEIGLAAWLAGLLAFVVAAVRQAAAAPKLRKETTQARCFEKMVVR